MFLSELYGRIGQLLQEHGDAEIMRRPFHGEGFVSKTPFFLAKIEIITEVRDIERDNRAVKYEIIIR